MRPSKARKKKAPVFGPALEPSRRGTRAARGTRGRRLLLLRQKPILLSSEDLLASDIFCGQPVQPRNAAAEQPLRSGVSSRCREPSRAVPVRRKLPVAAPIGAMPVGPVRQPLTEGAARPAQAAPPLQQLRIALAHGAAGAGVGARSLELPCFCQSSSGCRARSCQRDHSDCCHHQSMHLSILQAFASTLRSQRRLGFRRRKATGAI